MNFEWDEAKNRANIRKHGFDFARRGRVVSRPCTRSARYGLRTMARSDGLESGLIRGRVAFVAFAERPPRHDPHHLVEKGRS